MITATNFYGLFIYFICTIRGVARIWKGGGGRIIFLRFGNLRMVKPSVLLGGSGACPPRKFFKMVQFGVYLDQILTLKNFEKYHFIYIYIFFLNYYFLYKI